MKRIFLPAILALLFFNRLQAQQYILPLISQYPIVNQPGATLAQVADTLHAYANPADTGEGGALDQLMIFQKMWGGSFLL